MRWLALTLLLSACAGGEVVDTPKAEATLPPTYEDVVRQRIEAASDNATHTLRLNPTACRCPPFEIALAAHRQRVDVVVDDPEEPSLVALLEAAKAESDQVGRTYVVEGSLTDTVGTCGAGTLFVTLEPSMFSGIRTRETPKSAP